MKLSKILKQAGSQEFRNYAKGSDPKRLFKMLVDNAEREYGHQQGYSGEINQKRTFKIISDPVPKSKVNEIIRNNEHRIDKWDDYAMAIPVLKSGNPKPWKFKKIFVGKNELDARKQINKFLEERWGKKGYAYEIKDLNLKQLRPTKGGVSLKKIKKNKVASVSFICLVADDNDILNDNQTFDNPNAARKRLGQFVKETFSRLDTRDIEAGITMAMNGDNIFEKYKVIVNEDSVKPGSYRAEGTVEISRVSKSIDGYVFFGESPS